MPCTISGQQMSEMSEADDRHEGRLLGALSESSHIIGSLSIQIVGLYVTCHFSLPLVSIVEQLLVVQQLLMSLCGELKIGP